MLDRIQGAEQSGEPADDMSLEMPHDLFPERRKQYLVLEYLDQAGYTRRSGDLRTIRPPG